jgi:sulfur-carrier protein
MLSQRKSRTPSSKPTGRKWKRRRKSSWCKVKGCKVEGDGREIVSFFVEGRYVNTYTSTHIYVSTCILIYLSTCVLVYFFYLCTSPSPHYNTAMPSVRFPNVMKYYVNNQAEFFVPASSVQELVDRVVEQYPNVKFHLVDSDGQLRKHFNVFVNNVHIRDLQGMETMLKDEDKVILMASAAGGRET